MINRRKIYENVFRWFGMSMLLTAGGLLVILISWVSYRGFFAFQQYEIEVPLTLANFEEGGVIEYDAVLAEGLFQLFPAATSSKERRALLRYIPAVRAAAQIEARAHADRTKTQKVWISLSDHADDFLKTGATTLSEKLQTGIQNLVAQNKIRRSFNREFFTNGDSREPEHAGIYAAFIGSLWLMLVTLLISFPVGVFSGIYLQEFAPQNRWSHLIEININNLASVPSVIFGLMGLAFFLNWLGLPRSSPLVGGMVLSLMTLPTIIISTRAALAAVPPSIREAALALGASYMQGVFHHVVPLAMPGILTGAIIGMARALGETAPLLMIGMVAFIVETPEKITDPASVLPVQIYLWADSPERGFADKASAAIMILLFFLIGMNAVAVFLRRRFIHRW